MKKVFKFLQETETNTFICSICERITTDQFGGNSSFPLTEYTEDRCCDDCNTRYVIPDRLRIQKMDEEN